jgi:transposase InsO family protein
MSYTSNPNLERVRMQAVKLVKQGWTTRAVARHFGYSHSSVVRWVRRVQEDRLHGNGGVPARSSRPKAHPRALDPATVQAIIDARLANNRCAEVVHADLQERGIQVSLSSVKRTLDRNELLRKRSKWARTRELLPRPEIVAPGSLVQMDTIHFVDWSTGERFYIYTLVDLYSRWAYAEVHDKLGQAMSLKVALRAQTKSGFRFVMLQTDNGPEFQKYFHDLLAVRQITLRHSRVRQSNDNAHVERFNRTLQDELTTGYPLRRNVTQQRLDDYLDYYNNGRRHMGIAMRRPAELTVSMVQRS